MGIIAVTSQLQRDERGPGQGAGAILSAEVQVLQDEVTFGSAPKRNRDSMMDVWRWWGNYYICARPNAIKKKQATTTLAELKSIRIL